MIGLKSERFTHKVTFDVFIEKVATYVLREFKNIKDILPVLRKMIYPLDDMRDRCGPKELTEAQKNKDVEVGLQKQRIKVYIESELTA